MYKMGKSELNNLFKIFGGSSANQSLEIAVSEATKNGRPVDFTTFLEIFTAYAYAPRSRETYRKVFRLFDDENMGCITAKNLRRVLKELDVAVDENEIQEMIERADLNNDGVVTEDEFELIMTRLSSKI
jgi:Ca2+-binding EF-hand superfamily protein